MKNAHSISGENQQGGYTVVELLVGLLLFGIIGSSATAVILNSFRSLGRENRLATATESVRLASNIIASELRMSSVVSPYIPGTNTSLVNCSGDFAVTNNTLTFHIVHDDASGNSGLRTYLVGYQYDPTTERILRGQVETFSFSACATSASDPFDPSVLQAIAENIIQIDIDNDSNDEPIFSLNGSTVTITMGTKISGEGKQDVIQEYQTAVAVRN